MAQTKTQKVDTRKLGEKPAPRRTNGKDDPNRVGMPHGYQQLPFDLPVMMEVHRVLGPWENSVGEKKDNKVVGYKVTMDWFTCGVGAGTNVTIKLYKGTQGLTEALAVVVDDKEVFRWVLNPGDLPSSTAGILAEQARVDGSMAEALDLKGGEECLLDDDGNLIVLPAEDELIGDDDELIIEEEEDITWE